MQARRTRAYSSTLYILCTFHRVTANTMEDGGRASFQAPLLSTRPRLHGPLLLRPLHLPVSRLTARRTTVLMHHDDRVNLPGPVASRLFRLGRRRSFRAAAGDSCR